MERTLAAALPSQLPQVQSQQDPLHEADVLLSHINLLISGRNFADQVPPVQFDTEHFQHFVQAFNL